MDSLTALNALLADEFANAEAIITAAAVTGLPYFLAAALMEKESHGYNVYGNDRGGVYSKADPTRPADGIVTEANYRIFEDRVLSGETSNGVGPAQITHPSFIEDARARGIRLWVPVENIEYGFRLLAGYLGGSYTDESIRYAGTRYNGAAAYGDDLLAKARAWQSRMETTMTLHAFPSASAIRTNAFWVQLEAVFRQMGFDVYCAPSFVAKGYCAPGKHPHGATSRHFAARALDIGFDPASGAAESTYEKAFLDVAVRMLRARYPNMGVVWNRGPGDHRDHAHLDDGSYGMEGVYTGLPLPAGIIGFGARGEAVKALQANLNRHGANLVVDGVFGLGTFDALRVFQYAKGLVPDGFAGAATSAAFVPTPQPQPAPTVPQPKPTPTLSERIAPFRLAGVNAYGTAVALNRFAPPSGKGVILAARETPDHVTAGIVAGRHDIDVLPVPFSGSLPSEVRTELARLRPAWVRIAGGSKAVPDTTAYEALTAAGIRVP